MDYEILYIYRQYRQQIKDFLHSLVQSKPSHKQDVNVSSLILEVWDNKDSFKDQELSIDIEDNNALNDSTENTDVCDSLFMVDKKPTFLNDLDVPTYGQVCHLSFIYFHLLDILLIFLYDHYTCIGIIINYTDYSKRNITVLMYLLL